MPGAFLMPGHESGIYVVLKKVFCSNYITLEIRLKYRPLLTIICPKKNENRPNPLWLSGSFGGDEENRTPLRFGTGAENVRILWTALVLGSSKSVSRGLVLPEILTISKVDDLCSSAIVIVHDVSVCLESGH